MGSRTQVVVNPNFKDGVSTKFLTGLKLSDKRANEVFVARQDEIVALGMSYYKGLMDAMVQILYRPTMTHFETGGRMTRNIRVRLDTIAMTSTSWAPLSRRYRKQKPVSKTYYRKDSRGKANSLNAAFALMVSNLQPTLTSKRLYSRTKPKRIADSKNLARAQLVINYPAIPNPQLDRLLRASFASRRVLKAEVVDYAPLAAIDRLAFNETIRPWVSRFAKQVGETYIKRVKELHTPQKS